MPINYFKRIQLREFDESGYRINPRVEIESIIEGFYVFHRDSKDHSQLIFNDGFPVLVFLQSEKDSVMVKEQKGITKVDKAWASAGPVKNVHVKFGEHTNQILVVRFFPGAFYKLFGLNYQYFKNIPVAPFEPIATARLFSIEAFFECASTEQKISHIEDYVLRCWKNSGLPEKLSLVMKYIQKTRGSVSIQQLTQTAGVSYKSLERSFIQNIGLLPKDFVKLQRFFHAYLELTSANNSDLLGVAISNGYYDANHFIKDFKVFTGKSPLLYLKQLRGSEVNDCH